MKKRMSFIICFCLLLLLMLSGCKDEPHMSATSAEASVSQGVEENDSKESSVISSEGTDRSEEEQDENIMKSRTVSLSLETPSRQEQVNELLGTIDHQKTYKKLITRSVDGEESSFQGFFYRRFNPLFSYIPQLDGIDEKYPIECLRDMGNGKKYVVYSSKDGGLFYLFFRNEIHLSHSAYVSDVKSKKDFDSIQLGDTFEQVAAIDPDAQKWVECPYSVHLLEDGILQYTYQDGVVTKIDYSPDFVYKETFDTGTEEIVVEYDYSILAQDYPS